MSYQFSMSDNDEDYFSTEFESSMSRFEPVEIDQFPLPPSSSLQLFESQPPVGTRSRDLNLQLGTSFDNPNTSVCFLVPYRKLTQLSNLKADFSPTLGAQYRLFLQGYRPTREKAQIALNLERIFHGLYNPPSTALMRDLLQEPYFVAFKNRQFKGAFYPFVISLSGENVDNRLANQCWHCVVRIGDRRWKSPPYKLRRQSTKSSCGGSLPDDDVSTLSGETFFITQLRKIDHFLLSAYPDNYRSVFGSDGRNALPSFSSGQSLTDDVGDIAYWHPVENLNDKPQPGDIVAIHDSYVSKVITSPCMVSIVPFSHMPWKICKPPSPDKIDQHVLVTYLGEVEAKIKGPVNLTSQSDHFIVPSGKNDGCGIVLSAKKLAESHYQQIVGQVVRGGKTRTQNGIAYIPTLVCINYSSVGFDCIKREINLLSDRITILSLDLSDFKKKVLASKTDLLLSTQSDKLHTFGDPVLLENGWNKRDDEAAQAIRNRIFPSDQPSSTLADLAPVTIIHGLTGVGKSVLAKQLYEEVKMENYARYDQVGYFEMQGKTPDQIFAAFYLHFSPPQHLVPTTASPIPDKALNCRILLIIDDCEEWHFVSPFLRLGPKSHIVVTTQRSDLIADAPGILKLQLDVLGQAQAVALLLQRAPDCSEAYQSQIIEYSQHNPLLISLLASIYKEDGPTVLENLLTGRSSALLSLNYSIANSIKRIGSQEEIDLFCGLAFIPRGSSLPRNFVFQCWELMARDAGFQWSPARSQRLLKVLLQRSLIQNLTSNEEWNPDRCNLLYPNPLSLVMIHNLIWEYCSQNLPSRFPNFHAMLIECVAATTLKGRYNYMPSQIPELFGSFENYPLLRHFSKFNQLLQSTRSLTFTWDLTADLGELRALGGWAIASCRAHFIDHTAKTPIITKLLSPSGTSQDLACYCCVGWAYHIFDLLLEQDRPYLLKIGQDLLPQLLKCQNTYTSLSAQECLCLFSGYSENFAHQIIQHLEDDSEAQSAICRNSAVLFHIISNLAESGVDLPSFFDSMAEALVCRGFEIHSEKNPKTFDRLLHFIILAHQQGKLSNLEQILRIMWTHVEAAPVCWLSFVEKAVKKLELADDHWICPLLEEKIHLIYPLYSTMVKHETYFDRGNCCGLYNPFVQSTLLFLPPPPLEYPPLAHLVEQFVDREFKQHKKTHNTTDWLLDLMKTAYDMEQLPNLETILEKMWNQAHTQPYCWLHRVDQRIKALNLPPNHWILLLLDAKLRFFNTVQDALSSSGPKLLNCSPCSNPLKISTVPALNQSPSDFHLSPSDSPLVSPTSSVFSTCATPWSSVPAFSPPPSSPVPSPTPDPSSSSSSFSSTSTRTTPIFSPPPSSPVPSPTPSPVFNGAKTRPSPYNHLTK